MIQTIIYYSHYAAYEQKGAEIALPYIAQHTEWTECSRATRLLPGQTQKVN